MPKPLTSRTRFPMTLLCAVLAAAMPLSCASDVNTTVDDGIAVDDTDASASVCGWNMELSTHTLDDVNVAAPDNGAAYWVLRYRVQPTLAIQVEGHFPDARYFSFNTYDWKFRSFAANGVASSIADYQIEPASGSVNPWREPAPTGGAYTINVRSEPTAGEANTLPLAPEGAEMDRDGFLIFRAYRAGGDPAAVELPRVTVTTATESQTFAPCAARDENFGAAIKRSPRAGKPLPSQEPTTGFARINAGGMSAFANVDNAYLKYFLEPPPADEVLVVRGKAPTRPADDHPKPWPQPGVDVRYYSMCAYPSIFPAPGIRNRMPNGSFDYGCRDDEQTRLDSAGYYTYVIGTEEQRAQVDAVLGATFVPLSAEYQGAHFLLLRNLLPNSDFSPAVQNVPPDTTPEQVAAIMGDYYPQAQLCALNDLVDQGISACAT